MSRHQFRSALALLLIASGAMGAPASSHNDNGSTGDPTPPHPGPDFPSLESYYPAAAKRAGQEGATIIHICVDTQGKLIEPATVAVSSGNEVLDEGAVNLANIASGRYVPGTLDGKARDSCTKFKIKFELRPNPLLRMNLFRIPTISARIEALSTEYRERLLAAQKTVDTPNPGILASANPESVKAIRQYARGLDAALDESVSLVADMLDDIEYLGQSPDIPDAERTVFVTIWPDDRLAFTQSFRQLISDSREVVRSLDELADFVVFSTPRRTNGNAALKAQTSTQDRQLDEVRNRVLNAVHKLQQAVDALSKGPPPAKDNSAH